jgi:hypothetical protein
MLPQPDNETNEEGARDEARENGCSSESQIAGPGRPQNDDECVQGTRDPPPYTLRPLPG